MSDVNVILATNRLQIAKDGDDILLDSVTYINITSVNPLVYVHKNLQGSVPGMPVPVTAATVVTEDTNWAVELHMADGRIEVIKLLDVQNQAGWTNNATGYAQAEADIYAAFPGTGGGGSGTVTSINVSGGTTGFTFTGGPVTTSGTITMTGAPTILAGNTLYVDDVNGNDGTATRGVFNKPFLTIQAAIAAASANDCIIIRPGTYTGINDLGGSPAALNFYLEPGATGVDVTVDTITAVWKFYGAPVGDVTLAASGAYCYFYGGVDGTVDVGAFDTAEVTGKVTGVITCDTGNIYLYAGSCPTVVLEKGTLILTASSIGDVSTTTNGSIQGVAGAGITGTITGTIQVNGDTFFGTLTPPAASAVSVANPDGSWSWGLVQYQLNDATRNLDGTEGSIVAVGADPVTVNDATGTLPTSGVPIWFRNTMPAPYNLTFNPFTGGTVDGVTGGYVIPPGGVAALQYLGGNAWTDLLAAKADNIPVYRATISQTGTNPPVPTGEYNTTGITPTYGYTGVGDFYLSMPGLPTGGRVKTFITSRYAVPCFIGIQDLGDGETIGISSYDISGSGANDILQATSVEIIIDPA